MQIHTPRYHDFQLARTYVSPNIVNVQRAYISYPKDSVEEWHTGWVLAGDERQVKAVIAILHDDKKSGVDEAVSLGSALDG